MTNIMPGLFLFPLESTITFPFMGSAAVSSGTLMRALAVRPFARQDRPPANFSGGSRRITAGIPAKLNA
jgi:hypothetical protein